MVQGSISTDEVNMSYTFYKVMHIAGLLMVFMALGGLLIEAMSGKDQGKGMRRWAMISHGIGLLLVFVAGFGLMARIGLMGSWPTWIYVKIGIWTVLGGITPLIMRKREWSKGLWVIILALGISGAYSATSKPDLGNKDDTAGDTLLEPTETSADKMDFPISDEVEEEAGNDGESDSN